MRHEVAPMIQGSPVEAHTRDDLQKEGSTGHPGGRPQQPGAPRGFSTDDVDLRAELASSLRPSAFPADRSELVATAHDENAPEQVLSLLGRLPADATWKSLEEVWERAGGPAAERRAAQA